MFKNTNLEILVRIMTISHQFILNEFDRQYRVVPSFANISVSAKWKPMPITATLVTLPHEELKNIRYRVLSKYKKNIHAIQYSGRVLVGTVAVVGTLGAALGFQAAIGGLYVKHPRRVYLAVYANGNGPHDITNYFTRKMTTSEFADLYRSYKPFDKPGITNGMLEVALRVGNVHLIDFITKTFGDNYFNKMAALNDLVVAAVELLSKDELTVDIVKVIIEDLVKQGANLNEISRNRSEIKFTKYQCDYHTSITVLDSLHCKFISLDDGKWKKLQPIFKLISSQGGVVSAGNYCQRKVQSNSKPSIKYIQLPTSATLPKEAVNF